MDGSDSLAIGEFEHVAVSPSVVLLRINGRSSLPRPSPDWRPTLVADHGSGPERFAALPSPPDAEGVLRAAYSVPAELLTPEARFWLELQDREIVELGTPDPGTPRRPARDAPPPGADDPRPNDTTAEPHGPREREDPAQLATLSAALAEARDHASRLQGENETLSGTLEELEIWRGELERRMADTTTELAETRARLAQAHATAEMDALVARAEAEALEQAAHELIDAAGEAGSGS
jgi:hypothetical protein